MDGRLPALLAAMATAPQAKEAPAQSQTLSTLQLLQALQSMQTLPQLTPQAPPQSQALLPLQLLQALQSMQTTPQPTPQGPDFQTLLALLASSALQQPPQAPTHQAPPVSQVPPQTPAQVNEGDQLWQDMLLENRERLRMADHLQKTLLADLLVDLSKEQKRRLLGEVFEPHRFMRSFEREVAASAGAKDATSTNEPKENKLI